MKRNDTADLDPSRYPHCQIIASRFSDVDSQNHINNVSMAGLLEDARFRFLIDIGVSRVREDRQVEHFRGCRLVTVAANYRYLAECYHPDEIQIFSGSSGFGRSSWSVKQLVVQHSLPVSYCLATLVAVGENGPIEIDPDFRAIATQASIANSN